VGKIVRVDSYIQFGNLTGIEEWKAHLKIGSQC